jgi:hypothetical protein
VPDDLNFGLHGALSQGEKNHIGALKGADTGGNQGNTQLGCDQADDDMKLKRARLLDNDTFWHYT